MTANELSEKLEVSKRTIYRDLDQLSAAGIPVYTNRGKNGGISLLSDYVLDRTVLTHDERNKILESLQALGEISFEEEQAMYDKLQSFLGNETQDWLEVSFSTWGDNGKAAEWFRQIKHAILQHKFIEIEYAGANQNVTVRCIRPLKLCFKDQAYITSDNVEVVKLYPEQDISVRFRKKGHGYIYVTNSMRQEAG